MDVEQNIIFMAPFTIEEVKRAILGMKREKVSGPNGFPPSFFQEYWDIIKEDLMNVME